MTTVDDHNVLEEVLERGTIRVSVGDAEAVSGLEGFFLDYARGLGAAVFDNPNAIELVEEAFPDSLDSVANGVVDVSAQGTIPNLARDASRGLDFSPINFVSEQKVLVPDDSQIDSLADLSGLTVGTVSEANNQILDNALEKAGVSGVEIIAFDTTDADLYAAYDAGEIDALFDGQVSIVSEIPNLSEPDNQRFLDEAIARVPATLVVDENQSEWADVVNWVTYTLIQAEEFGITSENVNDFLNSEDPAIRQFLGLEGDLGKALGLSNNFTVNVIKAVGNYEEVYQRNFDEQLIPRGLNALANDGGIFLSNPFAGVVQPPSTDLPTFDLPTFNIYNLNWTGDDSYRVDGFFTFDSDLQGSIITENELEDLQLAFYNPSDELIQVFNYNFPNPDTSDEFNFNFDSATDTVLQTGESDTDTGFDLGVDFSAGESGIGFFSGEDDIPDLPPGGTIALTDDDPPNPSAILDQGGTLNATPRLITYNLSWKGDNGYTMQGFFSYNAGLEGSLITEDDLTDMQLAFFEPDGTLLQVFDYDFPNPDTSGEFNFKFDSATNTVLQTGESDSDTGFDLGIDFQGGESGTGFFTGDDDQPAFPAGIIFLGDANPPNPTNPLDQGGKVVAFLAEPFEVSEI